MKQASSKLEMTIRTQLFAFAFAVFASLTSSTGTAHAYMLKTTASGAQVRWSNSVVTMYLDEKLGAMLGSENVRSAVAMATDAWRGLPGVPDISISTDKAPGYRADQRTNGIYLVSPWPYAHDQLAVTVTTYDSNGAVLGADVLVNAEHNFAVLNDFQDEPGMQVHDLASVLTHEFGHVLGLGESPSDNNATMWPYIRSGEVHQRTLTKDDEEGIIKAYTGAKLDAAAGCGQASVVGGVRSNHGALQLMLLVFASLVVAGRRARKNAV